MRKMLCGILGVTLLFLAGSAGGTGLTGRFTTAIYTFERTYPDTVSQANLRVYQTARFRAMSLGRPEFSFQVYGRASGDLLTPAGGDPRFLLYHGYFRWEDGQDRFRITGGRQLVFSGVGVGRIDGLRADLALGRFARLDAYAGALVPADRGGFQSWNDGIMVGVHLQTEQLAGTHLGASFFRRNRRSAPYVSQARLQAGLGTLEILAGEVEQQMLGFDARQDLGQRFNLYARWDLSTPDGWKTRRAEGVLRYQYENLTVSGEVLHRRPYIDQNSIFSLFTQSSNREFSLRGNYRFNRFWSLFGEASQVAYDGEDGYRVNLGVNVLNGYIGYTRRRGYGGVADGLTANVRYRFNRQFWTDGGMHYSRFRLYEGGGTRSTVVTTVLGLNYRAGRYLSVGLQGQNLMQKLNLATTANPFPGMSHDFRFFFRATTWFFSGPGSGREAQ